MEICFYTLNGITLNARFVTALFLSFGFLFLDYFSPQYHLCKMCPTLCYIVACFLFCPSLYCMILLQYIHSIFGAQLSCFWCLAKAVMGIIIHQFSSIQVTQSCLTLCDPMDCSVPGLPVHYQLPEFMQTYVHWVGNAIQPSHPLSSPSPAVLNLSHHQGLFKWVSSSHQVAKVLEFQLEQQSFQWTLRTWLPWGWTGWISLQSKGLSRVFSNTTVQKH